MRGLFTFLLKTNFIKILYEALLPFEKQKKIVSQKGNN